MNKVLDINTHVKIYNLNHQEKIFIANSSVSVRNQKLLINWADINVNHCCLDWHNCWPMYVFNYLGWLCEYRYLNSIYQSLFWTVRWVWPMDIKLMLLLYACFSILGFHTDLCVRSYDIFNNMMLNKIRYKISWLSVSSSCVNLVN